MATALRRTLLIVDDEENILSALRRSLAREPWALRFASTVAEGLEALADGCVDVVLSDNLMPDQTGLAFLKQVRLRHPDTMRIMLTGHADLDTAIDAINQGEIYRFLTKPWDDIELRGVVRAAFDRLERERDNQRLLGKVRTDIHAAIERAHPELHLVRDATGSILLDDSEGEACTLAVGVG